MNCEEVQELISDAIDLRLSADARKAFDLHLNTCSACRFEYESGQMTKTFIQRRLRHVEVPAEVYYSVTKSTIASPLYRPFSSFSSQFTNPAVSLIVLIIVALGAVDLLRKDNAYPIPSEKNILMQSFNGYQNVLSAITLRKLETHKENEVREYFSGRVPFEVNIVAVKACEGCAGIITDFHGVLLAHVVHKVTGEGLLYVCEADMNEVMKGEHLALPEHAKAALQKTGWYLEQTPSRHNIILWKHKNTLCTAISTIEKDKLLALLNQ